MAQAQLDQWAKVHCTLVDTIAAVRKEFTSTDDVALIISHALTPGVFVALAAMFSLTSPLASKQAISFELPPGSNIISDSCRQHVRKILSEQLNFIVDCEVVNDRLWFNVVGVEDSYLVIGDEVP